jgi:uncharacterized protein (TIGR04141 family)
MAKKPSPAARTSLYRIADVAGLRDALQDKYLERDAFTATATTVSGRDALLVMGTMTTELVSWAATLQRLTAQPVGLGNKTAAAVLVIRNGEDGAWALTYGMGFQLLDQAKVDGGFGQRIAIRVADPRELHSVTRTTLDQRSRTDRFSIPSGDHLRGFGVGDFGELVTRLVAKAEIPSMTGGKQPLRIRGADALSAPLARTPDSLVADLDVLESILDEPAAAELEVLEQLVVIKHKPELIETLEGALSQALATPDQARLGLSWPHERIDENGTPTSFKIMGAGRAWAHVQDGTPELGFLLDALSTDKPDERLDRLKRMRVQLFRDADGEEPISTAIPGLKWLAFETEAEGKRYCLHDATWYLMDQDYARRLRERTQAIFDRDPGISLPEWPPGMNEAGYNVLAASVLRGTLLDQKFIYTDLHRRGIEVCDILSPDGTLVHVKNLESSAPASHLLSQALVSADALLHDEEARSKFRTVVETAGGEATSIPNPVRTVVLGVARRGRLVSSEHLFTFTQVTLVRQVAALQSRGVDVFVAPILRRA